MNNSLHCSWNEYENKICEGINHKMDVKYLKLRKKLKNLYEKYPVEGSMFPPKFVEGCVKNYS